MCGICGFVKIGLNSDRLREICSAMADSLRHRGPDDSGVWVDEIAGVAIGHRRLSIIGLGKTGAQPMISASGRYVLSYNGEIYNFRGLREELINYGYHFRGESDTEVLLAAIEQWGVTETAIRSNGMFAFTIWDREENELTLVRDRVGIKPLYYGWNHNTFFFASELKSIRRHPDFDRTVDQGALGNFIRFSYVPTPSSIYSNIYKLEPGSILRIKPGVKPSNFSPYAEETGSSYNNPIRFWSARSIFQDGFDDRFKGSETEAIERLTHLLKESVKRRMISDVPLGAFLSGGIDSTTIVSLMQAVTGAKTKTFTIGSHDRRLDESTFAKKIAEHLGTDHHELTVSEEDALTVIPEIASYYDEPFADSSQIPTFLLSRLTRRHVTVALSGDGGDELLAGYRRHFQTPRIWNRCNALPYPIRNLLLKIIDSNSLCRSMAASAIKMFGLHDMRNRKTDDIIDKLIRIAGAEDGRSLYKNATNVTLHPEEFLIQYNCQPTNQDFIEKQISSDITTWMRHIDLTAYLPDDILAKVDRASMANSLEVRVPILDHTIIEFAATLPENMLIQNGKGKHLLRKVLANYVPENLTDRPKSGFAIPLSVWLRGRMRGWAEDMLNGNALYRNDFFNQARVKKCWKNFLSDGVRYTNTLWNILVFQSWLESQNNY